MSGRRNTNLGHDGQCCQCRQGARACRKTEQLVRSWVVLRLTLNFFLLTPNQSFMRILAVETLYRRSAGRELGDGTPIEQARNPNLRVGIPTHRDVPSGWILAVVRAVAVLAIQVQGVRNTQPTFDRVELKPSEWLKMEKSMHIVGC